MIEELKAAHALLPDFEGDIFTEVRNALGNEALATVDGLVFGDVYTDANDFYKLALHAMPMLLEAVEIVRSNHVGNTRAESLLAALNTTNALILAPQRITLASTLIGVEFVSEWEEGLVTSNAKLDIETGEVSDIEDAGYGEDYEALVSERIEYGDASATVELQPDDKYRIVNQDDLIAIRQLAANEHPVHANSHGASFGWNAPGAKSPA